ncbi:hypothetical protein [Bradyrhizobium sp. 156]|uniref:hypothetical protein n=1 Tax=Bradyrhizobium sp. 156 TaxID=2782630 RepID=UPI001FF818B8|nr:hypothetical protein [Bradyrhizobium sp. 156]
MTEFVEPASAGTADVCLPDRLNRPRLRRSLAAEYLELRWGITVAVQTLAKWACTGGGPEYQRVNRTPLYSPAALDAWAVKKLGKPVTNTSQEES